MTRSLCVSWISGCDYPLFRKWLREYATGFFDEILIYWDVQFRHPFFWAFIQQDLANVFRPENMTLTKIRFIDPVPYEYGVGDWRNVATNELIKHATGDWIISIEQDWFAKDWWPLLTRIDSAMRTDEADLIGWENPSSFPYIHPAFFLIKREILEKTSKDFAAHPEINGCDHFGMITHDVRNLQGKILTLQEMGFNCDFSPEADMFHLGGVNQNYLNGLNPEFVFHRPEAFEVYNFECRQIDIPQDPRFLGLSQDIENRLMDITPPIDIRNNQWTKFFKI